MKDYSKIISNTVTGNDGTYEYSIYDNEVTIIKYLGLESSVIIPETIEGYPVTTIGSTAFINNDQLTIIPLSLVSTIESRAFAGCINLVDLIGDNVTSIGAYSFYNCKYLKNISISSVQVLGEYCFGNCSSLEIISIPGVEDLPSNIFSHCYGLKNIDISSVKTIGAFAFENCIELEYLSASDLISIDYAAFCYAGIREVEFPSLEKVSYDVFINCKNLEEASFPYAKDIGDNAFMNSGIESVNLPNVETLGNNTFELCQSLKCVSISKKLNAIGIEVFSETNVKCLTIDYGNEDISQVTEEEWNEFASKLTDIDVDNIVGRYVKNNLGYINFTQNDTEAPVITLNGNCEMTLEVGLSTYIEQGANVTDNSCEPIEAVIYGQVNTKKIGLYNITYTATDFSGNRSQVARAVKVVDTTVPVITLVGDSSVTVVVNTDYIEQGADVTDNSGESIVPVLSGFVDDNIVGQYKLTYNAKDSSGNQAIPVIRTVNVVEDANVRCSQIVAYDNRGVITKWALFTLDGEKIYESGNYLADEQFILDLDTLDLEEGTVFYLKAIVEGENAKSTVNLRYIPSSFTVYFVLQLSDSNEGSKSEVHYSGVVDSDGTPPTVYSTKIRFENDAFVDFWLKILTLEGKLIYKSDLITSSSWPFSVVFADLNILVGTLLKVEAQVMLGNDSSPYLYFQYMPENDIEVTLALTGSAFKTCIIVRDV